MVLCLVVLCVAGAPLKADSIVKMTEVDKLAKTAKMEKNILMYRLSEILTDASRPSERVREKKMKIVRFFGGELCGTKS